MHPQTTAEPANATGPSREPSARDDGAPSMDAQIILGRANDLLSQALATRDAAYAYLAENPDDVQDANAVVQQAQQVQREAREFARGNQRGDARTITNSLTNLSAAVGQVRADVSEHEGSAAGESVKRSAHQAELTDQKKTASTSRAVAEARAATARAAARVREQRRAAAAREEQEEAQRRERETGANEGNEGDPLGQAAARAAAARGVQRHSRSDDDAPQAHRVRRPGESRAVARTRTAVRRRSYDVANGVGFLDDQGHQTAQRLETGIVQADTQEERQYYERERGDAVRRRLLGVTFLDQEIENVLPQLENSAAGREMINADNSISSSLYVSSVINRLRRNGYIQGDRSMNPWAHETNSQWSHAAVQRIDRNGDGQLTAAEIGYALNHRYGVQAAPSNSGGGGVIQVALDAAKDVAAGRTALGRQVAGMLSGLQQHGRQLNVDGDNRVELWEACERLRARGITQIWDANRDGRINAADVPVMWNDPNKRRPPRPHS